MLLALLLVLLVAASRYGWLERADYWFYDTAVAWSGRPAANDILIVAIDESSLARLGRWPWSREILAALIERLQVAQSGPVLLDVILSEPQRDNPAADARLAAALAAHGRVVLPIYLPPGTDTPMLPLPPFAKVARVGHAQALVDSDGVSRRYLRREVMAGNPVAHVSEVLRALETGAPELAQTSSEASLVAFSGASGHYARLSAADVLSGAIPAERLRAKTILVGATATGLGDNLVTPLAGVNGVMPGVEFVANGLDALRLGRQLRVVDAAWHTAPAAALIVCLMLALLLTSPRLALVATAAFMAFVLLLAWGLLAWPGWWWAPAAPLAVAALAYPLWSWRRLESSLNTMTHETARIAALTAPGGAAVLASTGYLDPVEKRISAITGAVDRIAQALTLDSGSAESRQQRDDMMRHLAHDLRSPLVSLRALASQLGDAGDADQLAMLQRIDACARRSLDLTEQFLLLGRAQTLEPADFSEVDLVQLLHQCADDLWEDAQRAGARIERSCALDLALVRGDTRLLQRALLNLGWNALRHGPAGGVVTLSLEPVAGGFEIAVHDTGAGFPPEALARLVRSHKQGRSVSANSGYGLGLALVQLVAEKHRSELFVDHPVTGGFVVTLRIVYSA